MSNRLKMAQVESVLASYVRGWSQRPIAREPGVDRETVARYVGLAAANPAKLPTGSMEGLPASVSVPLVKRRSDCESRRAVLEGRLATERAASWLSKHFTYWWLEKKRTRPRADRLRRALTMRKVLRRSAQNESRPHCVQ